MAQLNTIAASQVDISAYGGATFDMQLTFTDSGNAPIDMSGYAFLLAVKHNHKPTTEIIFQLTTPEEIVISDNIVNFSKILDIPGGNYVYDLQITDAEGNITPIMFGKFAVTQNIGSGGN